MCPLCFPVALFWGGGGSLAQKAESPLSLPVPVYEGLLAVGRAHAAPTRSLLELLLGTGREALPGKGLRITFWLERLSLPLSTMGEGREPASQPRTGLPETGWGPGQSTVSWETGSLPPLSSGTQWLLSPP